MVVASRHGVLLAALTLLAARAAGGLVVLSDVRAAASRLGCKLVVKATGPAYRIELHASAALPEGVPGAGEASLLGYSDGFTQPTGAVHLESIQLRRFTGYWARGRGAARGRRYAEAPRKGIGLVLSVAVACWIAECDPFGCERLQLLAVLDQPRQHATLVRYYRSLGFAPLREVGDGMRSVGDRLAWGGVGTLMECSVRDFLERNGPKLLEL